MSREGATLPSAYFKKMKDLEKRRGAGRRAYHKRSIKTPEYSIYSRAKFRCGNLKDKDYGGRGVQFKFKSFEEFLAEVGRRPNKNYSLDRINPWGHYESGNVRWATKPQQQLHQRGVIEELARIGPEGFSKLLSFLPKEEN